LVFLGPSARRRLLGVWRRARRRADDAREAVDEGEDADRAQNEGVDVDERAGGREVEAGASELALLLLLLRDKDAECADQRARAFLEDLERVWVLVELEGYRRVAETKGQKRQEWERELRVERSSALAWKCGP